VKIGAFPKVGENLFYFLKSPQKTWVILRIKYGKTAIIMEILK
jgi:hypothetical protein